MAGILWEKTSKVFFSHTFIAMMMMEYTDCPQLVLGRTWFGSRFGSVFGGSVGSRFGFWGQTRGSVGSRFGFDGKTFKKSPIFCHPI